MLFQIRGQFKIFGQSVILTFLTFPNYLRHVHDHLKLHIIEIISQSVLSFIQISQLLKSFIIIIIAHASPFLHGYLQYVLKDSTQS